jgi:hypothetical protein
VLINKDNCGKPIGFIENLTSNDRVVTINQSRHVTTVATRDRTTGKVKSETFFGNLPITPRDR